MTSTTDTNKPRTFSPEDAPAAAPNYHQVAITPILPTSRLITLAGQVNLDAASRNVPFLEQVKGAYKNVAICLKAAGASPRDIIHTRQYIVRETGDPTLDSKDIADRGWGPLWREFLDEEAEGHRPPDTVLGVASLATKTLLFEIEVWAIVHA
ncbi:YjgF-like protein [Viridothelium virens]|uniref:YjgF-like protein n=1 Tax=Viridothelium virens TaxID=1048519 RepID=A0A6A6HMZ7_VIRVR|nr:YjgF-like protein [Viridothelium virens]